MDLNLFIKLLYTLTFPQQITVVLETFTVV